MSPTDRYGHRLRRGLNRGVDGLQETLVSVLCKIYDLVGTGGDSAGHLDIQRYLVIRIQLRMLW
jgi:hypothetical protein